MNGDLSLSQTLGGLRIANPDDEEAVASPSPSDFPSESTAVPTSPPALAESTSDDHPSVSSQSSGNTITDPNRPRGLSEISSTSSTSGYRGDTEYNLNRNALASPNFPRPYRASSGDSDQGSFHHPRQGGYDQPNPFSTQSSLFPGRVRVPSISQLSTSSRPLSSIYNHQNVSSSSGISQGSYRYRDDVQPQQPPGVVRTMSSKAAAAAMAGQVPSRQSSRSYRGEGQNPTPSNMLPPRRSSKRVPSPYNNSSGMPPSQVVSPYGIEGGPPPSSEEWKDRGAAVATRQELDSNGRPVNKIIKKGVKDFNFGRTLGEGSYSTVLAATDRQTHREYAVKVLDKRHIIKEKKVKYVNIEKDALNRLTEHPGIVRLYYTFQDERSLYFVLDLANAGELLGVLKRMTTFDEECTRFYAAQILDSIAYMHSRGIIHRDLKPENVLLDEQMHTKITDFGTAKILDLKRSHDGGTGGDAVGDPLDGVEQERANSFVGTAEYVSPELLTDKNACKASDLWAFGCIVYQLLAGRPPFKASNEYQTFQKIVALDYAFPLGFPPVARDLIERLLVLDPAKRLPIDHIKSHPFFDGIQIGKGLWRQKAPRLRSHVPPEQPPISLNGNGAAVPPPNIPTMVPSPVHAPQQPPPQPLPRPQLRAITELPPPSQLDIDWSPVLTRNNERILKLGNLNVLSSPAPHSPTSKNGEEAPRKFSRFFSSSTTKKRQRLVMITSSARVIIAAAGGDEKKAKMEVNLLSQGTTWRSFQDTKGLTAWCIDNRDKHLSFEDPRATTSDPDGSKYSTQEWMECIERAKELAISQSLANSYSADSTYGDLASSLSSPASASGDGGEPGIREHTGRNTLRKEQGDSDSLKGRKPRFSKRHSKNGLAAVF